MSADSKLLQRGNAPNFFRACIGTCLGFIDHTNFPEKYDLFLDKLCKDAAIKRERIVLKSVDLAKQCSNDRDKYMRTLIDFTHFLAENGVQINIVFTYFVLSKLPNGVTKYGADRNPHRKVRTMDFLNELCGYYPYISAWITSKSAQLRNTKIFLDNFEGEVTNAWDELRAHHEIKVLPRGDLCNPFISSADIVTKYIDEYLFVNRLSLTDENIKMALLACNVQNPHVFYVGHGHLPDIVPPINKPINCQDYYIRPMAFVIKEGILAKEILYIENTPVYQKILAFAYEKQTGIKFFSSEEDHKRIRRGDYIIYLGKNGKAIVDYLNDLGHGIIPINIYDHPQQTGLSKFK
jgi:hypothetical protein